MQLQGNLATTLVHRVVRAISEIALAPTGELVRPAGGVQADDLAHVGHSSHLCLAEILQRLEEQAVHDAEHHLGNPMVRRCRAMWSTLHLYVGGSTSNTLLGTSTCTPTCASRTQGHRRRYRAAPGGDAGDRAQHRTARTDRSQPRIHRGGTNRPPTREPSHRLWLCVCWPLGPLVV